MIVMKVICSIIENLKTWDVFQNNEIVEPIQQYLNYLRNLQKSPNTIRAYAYHLKHFWQYLKDYDLNWTTIKIDKLAGFICWLRSPDPSKVIAIHLSISKRTENSINAALAAVTAFYKFHEQVNHIHLYSNQISINPKYKPFLHHLNNTRLANTRVLKIKVPSKLPLVISREVIKKMLLECNYKRDEFMICLMYETGMRIGQILGLQHEDIKSWDNEIHIIPRNNNPNNARSKLNSVNNIPVTQALMHLYTTYLLKECSEIDSPYVFICLKGQKRGQILHYTAVQDLFKRFSKKVGQKITPHMLRHTHATELIKEGWDMALVKKRLGHQSIQTTINIYTHLNNQDLKNAVKNYEQRSLANECINR